MRPSLGLNIISFILAYLTNLHSLLYQFTVFETELFPLVFFPSYYFMDSPEIDSYVQSLQQPQFRATTPFRVSAANPARNDGVFDFRRCAALHNEILTAGWLGSGRSLSELHRTWKSHFEHHGELAEQARPRMSKELAGFLELAMVTSEDDYGAFFFYAYQLADPWPADNPFTMWGSVEVYTDYAEYDDDQFLKLYMGVYFGGHANGLILNQRDGTAIFEPDILDSFVTLNGRQIWFPLETVLSAWLDMIDCGKIQAVPPHVWEDESVMKYEFSHPWISHSWSPQILEETVQAFDELVDAIESRMPTTTTTTIPSPTDHPEDKQLLTESDLEAAQIPPGFARTFLTSARRPRFRYIAPGLTIPDKVSILDQPDILADMEAQKAEAISKQDDSDKDSDSPPPPRDIPRILLFRGPDSYSPPPPPSSPADDESDAGGSDTGGSDSNESEPDSNPHPGLHFDLSYLSDWHTFYEDVVSLHLPFGIGINGHARTSDFALIGEDPEDKGAYGEINIKPKNLKYAIYQPGYSPFTVGHGPRLVHVLKNWKGMVERGDWRVGEDGVEGGMEVWREADTERGWWKYVLPRTW